jgi:hypothetical protein
LEKARAPPIPDKVVFESSSPGRKTNFCDACKLFVAELATGSFAIKRPDFRLVSIHNLDSFSIREQVTDGPFRPTLDANLSSWF